MEKYYNPTAGRRVVLAEDYERYEKIRNLQIKRKQALNRKLKIKKLMKPIVVTAGSIVIIAALFNSFDKRVIPEGYEAIPATYTVEAGDTLTDIASKYYDYDVYGSYFHDRNDFINELAKQNGNIKPGDKIELPLIVSQDNPYVQKIMKMRDQAQELPRYVSYTIKEGDTLLDIAYKGASDDNDAFQILEEIASVNGIMDEHSIRSGEVIQIVNPQIGSIRKTIKNITEELRVSLENQKENDEAPKTY